MPSRVFALLAFVCFLLPAALNAAGDPSRALSAPNRSLAGQFLIAAPSMPDPRFARTVILMVRHDKDGALGIVINRPLGERPLTTLMDAIGESGDGVDGSVRIFAGGPVQPQAGFVLHSTDYRRSETVDIDTRLAMTSSREVLRDIAHKKGPRKMLVALGYAGWGPGQLEGELARRDWFTAPADPKLVFDEDRAKVWQHALERRALDL